MTAAPSLLGRIILRLSLTTFAAILFAYAWLWGMFQSTTSTLREKSLIENARAIASSITLDPGGNPVLTLAPAVIDAYRNSSGADGFAVRDYPGGAPVFSAGADVGPVPRPVDDDEDGSLYSYNPDGPGPETYFGEAYLTRLGNRQLVVQVVRRGNENQELIETVLADFFEDGGWLAGPFLLVLLVVSILTIRGTLSPLRLLSRQAGNIGPDRTDVRLPESGVPREVLPLVAAVNRALDRLEQGFQIQREFTANAAHELRTPLAVLMAHIDTLADRTAAASLRQDLQGMTHLIDQLLRVARVESMVVQPQDQADLVAIAMEVATYMAPVAIRADRSIEFCAEPEVVMVRGEADALFHALRNLVENALRHTPQGTTVTVGVDADPPGLWVRDHGPGIAPGQREEIFRRFWRADRRGAGAGLGLAIVKRTMDIHGGSVLVEDAEGGGARFRLVFPAL